MTERLTSTYGKPDRRRDVRELAEDFILDILHEVGRASLSEIAAVMQVLEQKRRERSARPAPARTAPPVRPPRRAPIGVPRNAADSGPLFDGPGRVNGAGDAPGSKGRDPFDITMPSELLDQAPAPVLDLSAAVAVPPSARKDEEQPPASVRRFRTERGDRSPSPQSPVSGGEAGAPEKEVSAPRVPAVALREGEQLVRSSGSGVVIRRVRAG